jgi:quercetin dioxygenase-like cupin family protein
MTVNASMKMDTQYRSNIAYRAIAAYLEDRSMAVPVEYGTQNQTNVHVIPLGETTSLEGKLFGASLGIIKAGEQIPTHTHKETKAVVHILQGNGFATYGLTELPYSPGQAFEIPPGLRHGFKATTDTLFYATQKGTSIINENKGIIDTQFE